MCGDEGMSAESTEEHSVQLAHHEVLALGSCVLCGPMCSHPSLPHPQVPWSSEGYGLTLTQGRMSTIISSVQEDSAAQVGGRAGHMTST